MNRLFFLFVVLLSSTMIMAQGGLTYQQPPAEIKDLVDAPLAPSVIIDSEGDDVILLYRDAYKSIAELSETEMRLGGLRINPVTNIGSRTTYFNNVKLKKAFSDDLREVKGLPANPRLSNFAISPDESKVALTNTTSTGVEAWILDVASAEAMRITEDMPFHFL